jgi:iron complex outermembrane recepter protein
MKTGIYLTIILIASSVLRVSAFQNNGAVIKGRVNDDKGNPLAGAGITVINTFLGTYSGNDGNYTVRLPTDGVYTLKYSFTGFETVIREIIVKGTKVEDVSLVQEVMMAGEVVVSATRAGERTPFSYSDITTESIRKKNNAQDLPYLIGFTPSLVETSETGTGIGYTSFRIRGTDGSRINVTVDGIPLNDAESQQVFWVDLPDLGSSVDNIQVQRGIGTSSNGSGAFGASVNIKSKSAENLPFADVSSAAGSYNSYKNTISVGTGLLADRFSVEMRYSDIRSDGYIKRTGTANKSAFVSALYRNSRSMLKANVILGQEHTGISWWGVPAEMLQIDRRYNPAGEYEDGSGKIKYYENESDNYNQNHYQLIYNLKLGPFISLNTALHYTTGKGYYEEFRQNQRFADYGLADVSIGDTVLKSTDLIRRKWMSNDFYGVVWSVSHKKNKTEAVIGGGINQYDGHHFGRLIWMRNAGSTEKDHQWYLNKALKSEISLYGKINYSFTDRLSGFGDLQYRHIGYKMNGPDDDLKDITQRHTYDFFNPKAGIFYSITQNQDAFLSFSVANKEPTRSDFKEASGDSKATPRAERLYDTEAGYSIRTGKAKLGINLYAMIYRDQLVPTGELSNVGYSIMTNVKSSYRTGIEFTADIKMHEKLEWDLNATISRNKILGFVEYFTDYITADSSSQYKSKSLGEVDIAYSPSFTGSSDISYLLFKNLSIHLLSKYVGKQYFDNTMNNNRMLDPYIVNNLRFDFNTKIKGIKALDIQLFINNIFNNRYISNGYGGPWYEDGAEYTWAYYFPQAGTNFLIKMDFKF